jgi:hypothetical protein
MPQYRANMYSSSGIVRIRKPHSNDVLSGRGGGINSHPGNKTFRDWVRERKEAYNLAITKAEKAEIAHEVINLVRSLNPPGRFLQRDPNSVTGYSWWVEVDSNRALAKTSQALREGAPQIRAAHKDELGEKMEKARKSRRRSRSTGASPLQSPPKSPVVDNAIRALQHNVEQARTQADQEERAAMPAIIVPPDQEERAAMPSIIVPPLVSNREFEETYMRPQKRGKFARILPQTGHTSETPPLTSVPTLSFQEPELPPRNVDTRDSMNTLIRSHSLALSDFSHGDMSDMKEEDLSEDFVDPFADESDILSKIDSTTPQKSPRLLRNLGRDENKMEPSSSIGRSNLSSRYVSPELKARMPKKCPTTPNPRPNCFCDCNRPFSEGGGKCICSDLADHLLHRADGLELYLYEDRIV